MTALQSPAATSATAARVHRVEVWPAPSTRDAQARHITELARQSLPAVREVRRAAVFLIEAPLSPEQLQHLAQELLADPVSQHAVPGVSETAEHTAVVEVHLQPGMMDPVAQSTRAAILDLFPQLSTDARHRPHRHPLRLRPRWRAGRRRCPLLFSSAPGKPGHRVLPPPALRPRRLPRRPPLRPASRPHPATRPRRRRFGKTFARSPPVPLARRNESDPASLPEPSGRP